MLRRSYVCYRGIGKSGRKIRKNIDVIDAIAAQYNIRMKTNKHRARIGKGAIAGEKVLLVKPLTYMNNSGESLAEIVSYYKIDPTSELLVIFDDISLAPGNLRIRTKGSAGGHNGIKSIIAELGTQEFTRIKVGVGEKPEGWSLVDHVLGHFDSEERSLVDAAVKEAVSAAELIVAGQTERAMNEFNAKR